MNKRVVISASDAPPTVHCLQIKPKNLENCTEIGTLYFQIMMQQLLSEHGGTKRFWRHQIGKRAQHLD